MNRPQKCFYCNRHFASYDGFCRPCRNKLSSKEYKKWRGAYAAAVLTPVIIIVIVVVSVILTG